MIKYAYIHLFFGFNCVGFSRCPFYDLHNPCSQYKIPCADCNEGNAKRRVIQRINEQWTDEYSEIKHWLAVHTHES